MPPIPTPFPIPTPELSSTQTLDLAPFWDFNNIAPAISMAQSTILWANTGNILVFSMIFLTILIVYRYIYNHVKKAGEDV
jgi:hypothetical protein